MLLILTSPAAILSSGVPNAALVKVLGETKAAKNPVGVISNHAKPPWFATAFDATAVQFLHTLGRQSGDVIAKNAKKFGVHPYDALVLAANEADVQMGKNGGAILIAAGWSTNPQVKALGICVNTPQELAEIIGLIAGWGGQWWYSGQTALYGVRALSDLSGYRKPLSQAEFAARLTSTVKNGGSRLNSLLTVTARSLLIEGIGTEADLVWGVYPSSSSNNDDTEVLSDFTHRLRTTVSRVRMCKRDEPLFIRHTPSAKRSAGGGGSRTDPTGQLLSIHINPFYAKSNRLKGKHVLVVDDCTTYGVSFGVASALLRRAGAKFVTGIALGKFGDQLRHYDIEITDDPYSPLTAAGFKVNSETMFPGSFNAVPQAVLQGLIS